MELSRFLNQARLHTYAGGGENGAILWVDGSRELRFALDRFLYRDVYIGYNPFMGEELVWEAGFLRWGMNYFGKVLEETVPASQVYNFLQQALRQAPPDGPCRGPEFFRAGSFTYVDKCHGELDDFTGEEVIYFREQQVYSLIYHGGRLSAG
jgi:hypothetical protein